VLVIDNASTPLVSITALMAARNRRRLDGQRGGVIWLWQDEEQPPNLYRMWNAGFAAAAARELNAGRTEWDIAVLNDDAVVPAGWMALVADAMRAGSAAAACSAANVRQPLLRPIPTVTSVNGRTGRPLSCAARWPQKPGDPLWAEERAGGSVTLTSTGRPDARWHPDQPGPHVPNTNENKP
jgi:hypothetical protein